MVSKPVAGKRVFVHVGVPKSGTSFLQAGLWQNRKRLRSLGVLHPAQYPAQIRHATLEVLGTEKQWGYAPGSFDGSWAGICQRARRFDGSSIISNELLASATPEQVRRSLAELDGTELHIVVTARDMARQLPAAWQQRVRQGGRDSFADFLDRNLDSGRHPVKARGFWMRQDVPGVLARWGAGLPAEHVHLVTNPPSGSAPTVLWGRFLSVLGIAPDTVELPTGQANSSLGITAIEVLRRLNGVLRRSEHPRLYGRMVDGYLVDRLRQDPSARPNTPASLIPRFQETGRQWVAAIEDAGYDVVGDLSELVAADTTREDVESDRVTSEDALDVAVATIGELLQEIDRLRTEGSPMRKLASRLPDRSGVRRVAFEVERSLRR
jgi:hypothetical protein